MKVGIARAALGFFILFALYQSAEGIGDKLFGSFALQAGLMLLCLLAAWPVGRFVLGFRGFEAYALEFRRAVPLWIAGGIVLAAVAKAAALVAGERFGLYAIAALPEPPAPGELLPILALAMVSTFVPSLAEDIITRGFWWRVPGAGLRGATFVLVTSTIYVLNHVYRLANGPAEWAMLFCFGIAYGVAVVRTGSLWAAVGVHWGWNLSNALLDSFVNIEADAQLAPLVSAAAHLAMAGLMLLWPRKREAI